MEIELKQIAQKKLEQMGATVHGVLVKNEAGAWAAVSDAGRVMWLDGFEAEAEPAQGGQGAEVMTLGRASRNGVRFEGRETYCQGWNDCMSAHPQPAQQGVPDELREKALELCRAVENEEEFPPAKFALRCLMLINQVRKLAATPQTEGGVRVPKGWKLVPLEVTAGQLNAVWIDHAIPVDVAGKIYQSMVACAPQPPQEVSWK